MVTRRHRTEPGPGIEAPRQVPRGPVHSQNPAAETARWPSEGRPRGRCWPTRTAPEDQQEAFRRRARRSVLICRDSRSCRLRDVDGIWLTALHRQSGVRHDPATGRRGNPIPRDIVTTSSDGRLLARTMMIRPTPQRSALVGTRPQGTLSVLLAGDLNASRASDEVDADLP